MPKAWVEKASRMGRESSQDRVERNHNTYRMKGEVLQRQKKERAQFVPSVPEF